MYSCHNRYAVIKLSFMLLCIVTLMSSCGFHLRGANMEDKPFPFNKIFIITSKQTEVTLVQKLKQYLRMQNITVLESATQDSIQLKMLGSRITRTAVASNNDAQTISEILKYKQTFKIYYTDKRTAQYTAKALITLDIDPDNSLRTNREFQIKKDFLQNDIIEKIVLILRKASYRVQKDNHNQFKKPVQK